MAQSMRIRCIRKTDRTSAHERIRTVGGLNPDGTSWRKTQEATVNDIKNKICNYHVERPEGHRVNVIVGRSTLGHEYLKTEADGEQPNNLLSLPECP
ncbi:MULTISPECIES: DUF3892 domain-containing protein [Sorangium]|uniref:DUF3892 domain-containing protein n=1 Tax=Sorangium TaxID=39643 RepID=UPI003D9C1A1F